MLVQGDPRAVRAECDHRRAAGARIGFVPTMGYLHDGHLALVREARRRAAAEAGAAFVVVSIFVNPTQFGPTEDLDRYPTDPDGDRAGCEAAGADLLFVPRREQIYPPGFQTIIEVQGVSQGLCGDRRPGHFRGVATVVAKLLHIVGPCVAVFGEKDYQQLQVVRRMVLDLDLPVAVVGHPTVREPDGLALSSRNAYLSPAERQHATCLSRALQAVADEAQRRGGALPAAEALRLARGIVEAAPGTRVDYIEVRDAATLASCPAVGGGRAVVALAVFLGRTRLIDNRVI